MQDGVGQRHFILLRRRRGAAAAAAAAAGGSCGSAWKGIHCAFNLACFQHLLHLLLLLSFQKPYLAARLSSPHHPTPESRACIFWFSENVISAACARNAPRHVHGRIRSPIIARPRGAQQQHRQAARGHPPHPQGQARIFRRRSVDRRRFQRFCAGFLQFCCASARP